MRTSSASDNPALPSSADSSEGRAALKLLLRRARTLRLSAIVALTCAIAALWLAEHSYRRLVDISSERQVLRHVTSLIDNLSDNLSHAESAQRSYLHTLDTQHLSAFGQASGRIARNLQQLQTSMPAAIHRALPAEGFFDQVMRQLQEMNRLLEDPANGSAESTGSSLASSRLAGPSRLNTLMAHIEQLKLLFDERATSSQAEFNRLLNTSRLTLMACVPAALLAFLLYLVQTARLNRASLREQQWLAQQKDRLEQQVQERTQRLTELANHLQNAVEDERARLARELHDELGALMTAAKLDLARLRSRRPASTADTEKRLAHLNDMLNQSIALKRRIIESLHPSSLKNLGLAAALEILTREFRETSGLQVDVVLDTVTLNANSELTVYRVVQEALTNISKYAQARCARVVLRQLDTGAAEISITDDGVGFDAAQVPVSAHGLAGMRHRLDACGGNLSIDSAPGRGTHIRGTLPSHCVQG